MRLEIIKYEDFDCCDNDLHCLKFHVPIQQIFVENDKQRFAVWEILTFSSCISAIDNYEICLMRAFVFELLNPLHLNLSFNLG